MLNIQRFSIETSNLAVAFVMLGRVVT